MLKIERLKPRERLRFYGPEALSLDDLMMLILRQGQRHYSVEQLAYHCLNHYSSLHQLQKTTVEELMTIPGIGEAKACEIIAAIELGRRLEKEKHEVYGQVLSSFEFGHYLIALMGKEEQEQLQVFCLNIKNQIIATKTIFKGGVADSMAHPREIYYYAIQHLATSIVMVHNHPSDHIKPSANDLALTKQLQSAGELVGIPVLDHFIVSPHHYFSFKEEGLM